MEWADWIVAVAMHPVVLIAVGSAIGGNCRYYLGRWVDNQQWPGGLPWGTFVINVSGSFLLGFFAVVLLERLVPAQREMYLFLGTGLIGGYTTFSTFEWETFKLVRDGSWLAAVLNVVSSVLLGFIGMFAGVLLAHLVFGKR